MQATYRELYPELTDAYEAAVGELAVRKGLWLLAGSHYRRLDGDRFRNTAYLAHPDGRLESQDKLHLTPPEVVLGTDRGEEVLITTVGPARVGIQICMDIQFPEVTRYLALQGVDLVLCPSLTWNRRGAHRVRYSSISRALENQLYVATSISLGTCGVPNDGAIHGTGRALVSCPIDARFGIHDGLLAQAESDGEEIVVAELDFDRVRESRADPEPPGLKNLRPELYRSLISDVVAP
jgi:predicted amidohydrolase